MNFLHRLPVPLLLIATFSLLLTACQPISSTPVQQNEHSQDGSFAATISNSGQYAVISSLYHGVAVWDLPSNGLLYNWYQTPAEQRFIVENEDGSTATSDNNFVFATAIAYDDSHALLADKHRFSLWRLSDGENVGYWSLAQEKVVYRVKEVAGRIVKTDLFDVIEENQCTKPDSSAGEECAFTADIRAIDVSNQGKHILLGRSDGTVVHINLSNGRRLEFLGHQQLLMDSQKGETFHLNNAINSVAISPNGLYALSGSSDQSAYLWNTKTGQVIHKFQHQARVTMVALDPKGRFAFTADSKKEAIVWDIQTGKKVANLNIIGRQQIFSSARFNADGDKLITGSPNRKLILWDSKTGENLQEWLVTPRKNTRPASAVVYSAAFINQDRQIISESSAGLSEIWEVKP